MSIALSANAETFAARRRGVLARAEEALRPAVALALVRAGLPDWDGPLIPDLEALFDLTVEEETDLRGGAIDDLRAEFIRQVREALAKTKRAEAGKEEQQVDTITRWLSTAAVNAATEAATAADPEPLGLEWVDMKDADVRHTHRDASGQVVPIGGLFSVGGVEVSYPGQPVGDPSLWLNCRCVARPVALTEAAGATATFATDDDEPREHTSTVLVALPAESDPVQQVAHEDAHVTLLFFGDSAGVDQAALEEVARRVATSMAQPLTETISGTATLGEDQADVLLLDAVNLAPVREALAEDEAVTAMLEEVEQFPTWIPHLTIGYPDTPRRSDDLPEKITFDRLALWHGDQRTEFPFGEGEADMPDIEEDEALAAAAPVTDEEEVDEEVDDNAPEIGDEDLYLPVPWHGVLAPEGVRSGDGRQFAPDSLRHRDLPLPLKFMPADADGHDGSYTVGRIDRIWRQDGKILGEGVFDQSPEAYEAVRQIAEQMVRGVSVDVDDATASADEDEDSIEFSSARIAAATIVAIPAFAEAFVALGPWADDPNYIPEGAPDAEAEDVERSTPEEDFAISEAEWDGSASRFSDEEWQRSCVLDRGEGHETPKERYALPVREPNGDLSRAGVHAAAARINQVDAPAEAIAKAKAALRSAYDELDEEPPEVLQATAEEEEFAVGVPGTPGTKDGPGWITHPRPTARIRRYWVRGEGALKIRWGQPGDFNRCRRQLVKYVQNPEWLAGLCANMHKEALGIWPGQHSGGTVEMTEDNITASVALADAKDRVINAEWVQDPELDGPTPLTVTEDGRVFGHLATWGTCHIGIGDACVTAPKSATDYSYFHTGEIETDAGPVSVGQISLGGGHADLKAGVRAALSHYDSTSSAVADVRAGEDEHGIWVAGAVRPGADIPALRAAALSGDWRRVGGNLELVAALAVNVPGFPIPRPSLAASGQVQTALVAASVVEQPEDIKAVVAAAVDARLARIEREKRAAKAQSMLGEQYAAQKKERVARARAALNQ